MIKVLLRDAHARLCSDVFGLDDGTRVAVLHDLYDVGTLMRYYDGQYYLWCRHRDGVFELRAMRASGSVALGFVLLVGGEIIMFFNDVSSPYDWWLVPCGTYTSPPFFLDRGFNCGSVHRVLGT